MRGPPALALAFSLALLVAGCVAPGAVKSASTDAGATPFSERAYYDGAFNKTAHRLRAPGPFAVGEQVTTMVKSTLDGADIQVFVVHPDVPAGTKVPVIADAGPYFPPLQGKTITSPLILDFVSHGFAFALVSVRGTGDSGGCMDLMGPKERHDIDQAISWLGEQEWSNGNVGMFGGSYDGSTQWEAASTGNPHLKTIVPLAAIPDLHTFFVRNGSYMAWTPAQFSAIYWLYYGPVLYSPLEGRSAPHIVDNGRCPESVETTLASVFDSATSERDPWGVWAARDWRDDVLANYEGSIYLIQGLRDVTVEPHNAFPFVDQLRDEGRTVKVMIGPWGHELPWRGDALQSMLSWYDRWLRDNASADLGPAVQVMDDEKKWRSEDTWPPTDAVARSFHLAGDGTLVPDAGASFSKPVGSLVPVPDPTKQGLNAQWKLYEDSSMDLCQVCATFATAKLARELRLAGAPVMKLSLTPSGPGHVAATLYAEKADGKRVRLAYAIGDLGVASGGSARAVVPGVPLKVSLQFEPTDGVVPEGGRLVLVVHQGGVGLRWPPTPPAPLVLSGGELTALTFERGAGAFFVPPEAPGDPTSPR